MPKRSAEENGPVKKAQKTMGHWSLELLKLMKDPEYIVKADDLITIIKDGYNKAKFHYLILPNKRLHSIRDVKAEHLSLLKHMEKEAENLIKESPHKECNFKIGYHSVPSMSQLHLHVISDDFCSPYLKNKKHFNSFNTKFFLNSKDVIKDLENNHKLHLESPQVCEEYLKLPLKCPKCGNEEKNMPKLKIHLEIHN